MQRTILVPLDGSELSETSLPWATTFAQSCHCSLTLARVVDYPRIGGGAWPEESMSLEAYDEALANEEAAARQYLDAIRERLTAADVEVQVAVRHGSPPVALLDLADEVGATAIVIASHGRGGVKRFVLGSVAMQLVSHAAVPVLVVRASTSPDRRAAALDRLLVPLDGSELAERALDVAREFRPPGSTLVLVRVVPWPRSFVVEGDAERVRDAEATAYGVSLAKSYLERLAASLRAVQVPVETQVIVSETRDTVSRHLAVAAVAENVDVIVMSTHGRSGVTGWLLGSVADEVVRNVDRPVLLISARALAARTTGQLRVGDVMTRDVVTLRADEPLVVALRKLVRRRASGAPVLDADGNLVGVVSQRDIMAWHERMLDQAGRELPPTQDLYLRRLRSEPVSAVMSSPPTAIQESASLGAALALLRDRGIHRLPVLRDDRLVGILTGSDVLLALLAQLESTHETQLHEELDPSPESLAGAATAE